MRAYCAICVCICWVIGTAFSPAFAGEGQGDKEKVQRKLEQWKSGEGDILFYGKVIDQTGASVPGVTIGIDVPEQTGYMQRASRKQTTVTDQNGRFEVSPKTYGLSQMKGSFLFIESITKDGYESVRDSSSRMSFIYRGGDVDRHVPQKEHPVVFQIRKKEALPSFLVEGDVVELEERNRDAVKPLAWDFIRRHRIKDTQSLVYDGEPVFPDLQVKATFNTNDATWTAILSPGNTNGGIIVSEQLLYGAPDTGYQPEYTFTPQDRRPVAAKYIYLKSRDPAIYTRVEIEHINANKDFFRLSGKSVTNPYGDRNLEQATDLPYEVTKQLTDEAKAAFRQNKRPTKHDLPKLVKEAKDKADKGKP